VITPLQTARPDWRTRLSARAARLARRTGHRGAFLLFLAVLDILFGYSLWATAAPQRLLDLFLPWEAWGGIWVAVGLVCIAGAASVTDRWAFAAAAALKAFWAALAADEWLFQGAARGWVSAVIWLCFALTVLVVSSWPEPPPELPGTAR
jgi:hypothetical protein